MHFVVAGRPSNIYLRDESTQIIMHCYNETEAADQNCQSHQTTVFCDTVFVCASATVYECACGRNRFVYAYMCGRTCIFVGASKGVSVYLCMSECVYVCCACGVCVCGGGGVGFGRYNAINLKGEISYRQKTFLAKQGLMFNVPRQAVCDTR